MIKDEFSKDILNEATRYLQDLVRIDTTNPPGNERPAAEYIADVLNREGIIVDLLGAMEERKNLIARVLGDGSARPVLLVSHLDVVSAVASEWDVHPFSGVLKNSFIWGRGAMDCKYRVVTHTMVLLLLKRNNIPLKRDVVIAACADEELGGFYGMKWLSESYPEKVQAEFVLGEGGGGGVPAPGGKYSLIGCAERGSYKVFIKIRGNGGHSYKPRDDNALLKLGEVLNSLKVHRLSHDIRPSARDAIKKIAEDQSSLLKEELLALLHSDDPDITRIKELSPELAKWLEPTIFNTICPTMVQGGESPHCHPIKVELICNLRVLPGQDIAEIYSLLMDRFNGIDDIEIEMIEEAKPSESGIDTSLYHMIDEMNKELNLGVKTVPWLLGGATDVRFLRSENSTVYGFFPSVIDLPYNVWNSITHGINERISQENLMFAIKYMYNLMKKICT